MGEKQEIISDGPEMSQNLKLNTDGKTFSEGCKFKFS